jgi:YidC/Oxa1 family membrane protein insertase
MPAVKVHTQDRNARRRCAACEVGVGDQTRASQFGSIRQLLMKNMQASALDNPFAKQRKIMMYLMPFMFVFLGFTFAIGILLDWLTTNLWSMGQQFCTIRRTPAPG